MPFHGGLDLEQTRMTMRDRREVFAKAVERDDGLLDKRLPQTECDPRMSAGSCHIGVSIRRVAPGLGDERLVLSVLL